MNSLDEILAHPQIAANGLIVEHTDAVRGRIGIVGPPVKMSDTATGFERPAPAIGEHTGEVLHEFGLGADEIAGLRAAGVI